MQFAPHQNSSGEPSTEEQLIVCPSPFQMVVDKLNRSYVK
jgi:hypothetical protein